MGCRTLWVSVHVSVGYRTLRDSHMINLKRLFSREWAHVSGVQGCIHDKLGDRVPHARAREIMVEPVQSPSSPPC